MSNPNEVYDYGLLMPEGSDFNLLDPSIQEQIDLLGGRWTPFPIIGTRPVNGMAMCYVRLLVKLSKAQLEDLITYFGLPWVVMGIRSAYKIIPTVSLDIEGNEVTTWDYDVVEALPRNAAILEYLNDIQDYDPVTKQPIFDVSDNPVMRRPTLDDDIYIPVYAGTDPIKL